MRAQAFRLIAVVALGCGVADCKRSDADKPAADNQAAPAQPGMTKGVDRTNAGKPAPGTSFVNGDGDQVTLADVADGKPVLVNLWASWCAPCVKELPTLDKLSQVAGAVKVAAISQDSGPHPSVEAFLKDHKIVNLESYQDKDMALSGKVNAQVLPSSILYDARGREVWRYVGDLDWTSPEAAKLLAEAKS